MAKHSPSFKREVVDAYLEGPSGYKVVAARFGLHRKLVELWVAHFRQDGQAGLDRQHRHYSAEFKLQVLQHMWREELSHTQTMALYGIRGKSAVSVWERTYNEGGIEALMPRPKGRQPAMSEPPQRPPPPPVPDRSATHEELLKENAHLRAEVAYLKKIDALVQAKKTSCPPKKCG